MEKEMKVKLVRSEDSTVKSKNIQKRSVSNEKFGKDSIEWFAHDNVIDRLSKPKKHYEPPPVVRKKVPLEKLLPRIERLSQPKFRLQVKQQPIYGMKV